MVSDQDERFTASAYREYQHQDVGPPGLIIFNKYLVGQQSIFFWPLRDNWDSAASSTAMAADLKTMNEHH